MFNKILNIKMTITNAHLVNRNTKIRQNYRIRKVLRHINFSFFFRFDTFTHVFFDIYIGNYIENLNKKST